MAIPALLSAHNESLVDDELTSVHLNHEWRELIAELLAPLAFGSFWSGNPADVDVSTNAASALIEDLYTPEPLGSPMSLNYPMIVQFDTAKQFVTGGSWPYVTACINNVDGYITPLVAGLKFVPGTYFFQFSAQTYSAIGASYIRMVMRNNVTSELLWSSLPLLPSNTTSGYWGNIGTISCVHEVVDAAHVYVVFGYASNGNLPQLINNSLVCYKIA